MAATYEYGQRAAEPFWRRARKFARLPLDRAVLARIGLLAVGAFIAALLPLAGDFGGPLLLAAAFGLLVIGAAYGFRIVERSSKGYLIPSDYGLTDETAVGRLLPFKFAALVTGFALVAWAALRIVRFDGLALVPLAALFVTVMPAASVRLVVTGSLRGALAPGELLNVMRQLGKPYGALVAAMLAALAAALLVAFALGAAAREPGLGFALLAAAAAVVAAYVAYAACATLGYAMFQHADLLQIALLGRGDERLKSSTGRHANVRARTRDALIGQMLTHGEVKEAISLLNDDLAQRPTDLSLHARLHKLLLAEGYGPRIEDHTEKYLALLVKSQNWREAIELADEALARRADWSPRPVELLVPLARAALQKGRGNLAATLIRGFDKKHPNHPDVPQVYFIGAQLMAEAARRPDEARRIIDHLLQRYSRDPVAEEARRYLATL
jgi:hypothetical protein